MARSDRIDIILKPNHGRLERFIDSMGETLKFKGITREQQLREATSCEESVLLVAKDGDNDIGYALVQRLAETEFLLYVTVLKYTSFADIENASNMGEEQTPGLGEQNVRQSPEVCTRQRRCMVSCPHTKGGRCSSIL